MFKASRDIEDIYELTYIRKDAAAFPPSSRDGPCATREGAIIGYLLIGTDNTARKQAAEMASLIERTQTLEDHAATLRRSEDRTNYALGWARIGVWELDLATQHLSWSETMASVFGLGPEQAPGSTVAFLDLIHPDDRLAVEESLTQAARDGAGYEVEFRALLPDGSIRWMAGRAWCGRRPAGLSLGIAIDIMSGNR